METISCRRPPVSFSLPREETAPIEGDMILSNSESLSRREVLTRRSSQIKELSKIYKFHYWMLMEELRAKYRKYYWHHGESPFMENAQHDDLGIRRRSNDKSEKSSGRLKEGVKKCAMSGCKSKAMALSRFCHSHILSDSKQVLYTACSYVIKSVPSGPIHCGEPIMRSVTPPMCSTHMQKTEKHLLRALKRSGLHISSLRKSVPKLHVVIPELVHYIQSKRLAAKRGNQSIPAIAQNGIH